MLLFAWVLLTACGGAKDTPECSAGAFDGTLFFADEAATGAIRGTATWPDTVPDGLDLEVGVSADGAYYGASSDALLALPTTCGGTLDFRVAGLDPGTYSVVVRVQAAEQSDTGFDIAYLAEGASEPVEVTDGEVDGVSVSVALLE